MRFKRENLVSYTSSVSHQDSTNFLLDASRFTYNTILRPDSLPRSEGNEIKSEKSGGGAGGAKLSTPELINLWKEKGCLYQRISNHLKSSKRLLREENEVGSADLQEDEYESLPSLTDPEAKNIKRWKELRENKLAGDLTSWDLCLCNADLIDMIEEGEAFTEHSFMDHFLSSVPGEIVVPTGTGALVTSREDDDYQELAETMSINEATLSPELPKYDKGSIENSSDSLSVPEPTRESPSVAPSLSLSKIDYSTMISQQDLMHQKAELSYARYCELMKLFAKDQSERFERLRHITLPLFSTPEHFDYALRQQQEQLSNQSINLEQERENPFSGNQQGSSDNDSKSKEQI